MATLEDVRRLALALPETDEKTSWGNQMFRVREKGFVWERPLGTKDRADLDALGREVPEGEIAGIRVPDVGEKQALVEGRPDVYFTIPHLDGYPAVLVRLAAIELDELEEMIVEAWLDRAPKRLAADFIAGGGRPAGG
ncbi:MmcQ/YjbR family DNA-binding protein [Nocardioides sp. GY 10113]|uniref:MmcQ/YjbR family DNA-binding protein n=1 Tax=Nocardioides sp. GY 10113 TaxID=2569761 RepID=UPI0010A94838|nr:MmcQ/YjbR family DNA-binding protein [Nocardioides sp. GY 10113]TIC88743.1 MmcQ/YjbR family DNA-binding protein [Nocardioides sp. GY 10113]